MQGILIKMQSVKEGICRLTIDIPKENVTVDFMDYVSQTVDVRIPDETEN